MAPASGWPVNKGSSQPPEPSTRQGCPYLQCSSRSSGVSNTISPKAPKRITRGGAKVGGMPWARARFAQSSAGASDSRIAGEGVIIASSLPSSHHSGGDAATGQSSSRATVPAARADSRNARSGIEKIDDQQDAQASEQRPIQHAAGVPCTLRQPQF